MLLYSYRLTELGPPPCLAKLVNDPSLYRDAQGLVGQARRNWLLRFFGGGGGAPPEATPAPGTPAPTGTHP